MGWKDLAKLGKDFVEAKKDELLTSDADKKAEARGEGGARPRTGSVLRRRMLPRRYPTWWPTGEGRPAGTTIRMTVPG